MMQADVTPVPAQAPAATKKRSSGRVGNLIDLFQSMEEPNKQNTTTANPPTNKTASLVSAFTSIKAKAPTPAVQTSTPVATTTTSTPALPTLTRTRSLTNGSMSSNIRLPANLNLPSTPRHIASAIIDKKQQTPNTARLQQQDKEEPASVDVNTMVVNTHVSQGVKQRLAKLIKKSKNLEHTPTTEEPVHQTIFDKKLLLDDNRNNGSEDNSEYSNTSPPNSQSPRSVPYENKDQHDMEQFYQVLQTVLPFPPPALQAALGVEEDEQLENSSAPSSQQSYHSVNIPTMDLLQAYRLKSIVFHRRFKNFAFHNPFPQQQQPQPSTPSQVLSLASEMTDEPVIPQLPDSLFGSKSLDFNAWQQQMKSKIAA